MQHHGKLFRSDDLDPVTTRMNPNVFVGRTLREHREDRDITQWDLMLATNEILIKFGALGFPICGQCTLSRIESGGRSLSLLEGLAIAEILGVHPTVFAPWQEHPQIRALESSRLYR